MQFVLITVRDQKSMTFGQVAAAPNINMALRAWEHQLNDPQHKDTDQAKWPEDFSLWHIGTYDDQSGLITPLERPAQLAVASDLKRPHSQG